MSDASKTAQPDWQRIEDLFHEALKQPAGRDSWLRTRCGNDPNLHKEVASLLEGLRQHQQLSAEAPPPQVHPPDAPSDLRSARFGPYQPVRLLGRGGMGAVYLANRADGQFEQAVALKVMASHLTGAEFTGKFQMERQVLASLNHPNITRLLDGGMSSTGEPYLAMEYIEGQAFDRHCDEHRLDIPHRLRLFLRVCDAVDYAHRNLILHRDLKPSNILVTAEGAVKLLDFGTASLIAENRELTAPHARMVTARYASPEHLLGERATQASDVFSLGVILYEALTGAWPFGNPNSAVSELQRAMMQSTPVFPATAVTDEVSAVRGTSKARLQRLLKGDLAAIALKALENDASRRYSSARELAEDLERFLNGQPVHARPQTSLYRASKFVRRRWLPVLAAATFVVGLVAATIISVNQARAARQEAGRATRMADFANSLFVAPNAAWYSGSGGKGKETKLVDVLEPASHRMSTELKSDPETEFRLRTTFARTYVSLMMFDQADREAERAASLLPRVAGKEPEAQIELAIARCELMGRRVRWKEADPFCNDAVVQARRLVGTPNRLLLQAASDWSTVQQHLGNRKDYEALVREALAAVPHPTADDMPAVLVVQNNLAVAEITSGNFAAGVAQFRSILSARASLPDNAGETASVLYNLGFCEFFLGDLAQAESDVSKAVEIAAASPLGNDPRVALVLPLFLSVILGTEGKQAEGEAELAKIKPRLEKFPPAGGSRLFVEMAEGILALRRGEATRAEQHFRGALKIAEVAGGKNYGAAWCSRWLAAALEAEGHISEARAAADAAVRTYSGIYVEQSPPLLEARAYAEKLAH